MFFPCILLSSSRYYVPGCPVVLIVAVFEDVGIRHSHRIHFLKFWYSLCLVLGSAKCVIPTDY